LDEEAGLGKKQRTLFKEITALALSLACGKRPVIERSGVSDLAHSKTNFYGQRHWHLE
jgi:hypothetical protein